VLLRVVYSCLTHRIIRARYEKTVRRGEPLDADDRNLLREIVELHLLLSFKVYVFIYYLFKHIINK
jgi:hypothetical protein